MRYLAKIILVICSLSISYPSWAALQTFDGKLQNLDQYLAQNNDKGKWLLVMFWSSDCHICNQEAEQYIQFHEAHKDKLVSILGISLDGQQKLAEAKAFVKRHDVTFPNLIGEPDEVANVFMEKTNIAWSGTPTFLLFNPQGQLLAQQAGAIPPEMIENFIRSQTAQADQH